MFFIQPSFGDNPKWLAPFFLSGRPNICRNVIKLVGEKKFREKSTHAQTSSSLALVPVETTRIPIFHPPAKSLKLNGVPRLAYAVIRRYEAGDYSTETSEVEYRNGWPPGFKQYVKSKYGFWIQDTNKGKVQGTIPHELEKRFSEPRQRRKRIPGLGRRSYTTESVVPEKSQIHRELMAHLLSEWIPDSNRDYLQSMQNEAVEFAIQNYVRRNWSPDFKDELRLMAMLHWDSAKYIIVRNKAKDIVGTLRLISSGNEIDKLLRNLVPEMVDITKQTGLDWISKTPEEQFGTAYPLLSKRFPAEHVFERLLARPAVKIDGKTLELLKQRWTQISKSGDAPPTHLFGEAIEPGNFSISKDVNAEVFKEIFTQLVKTTFDPRNSAEYNMNGKVFYTYGDRAGKMLYAPLGYSVVEEQAPIQHDGREWWLLQSTPEKLNQFLESLAGRSDWDEKDVAALRNLMTELSHPPPGKVGLRNDL